MEMCASGLGAAHPQHILSPVQIVELKAADLADTQTVGDQQHQDRAGADVERTVALGSGEQAEGLVPAQARGIASPGWRHGGMIPSASPGVHQPCCSAKRKDVRSCCA